MPTIKQKKAFKAITEKHRSVSRAMREAGYDDDTASKPSNLTRSKGWKELMDTYLPDSLLAKKHKELLEQKQLAYFTFSKQMSDEEIIEHVKAAGFDVIVVRESEKGKLAFYSIDDSVAKKGGLDMAYKLRGSYAPDKSINVNLDSTIPTEKLLELANRLNETTRALHPGGSGSSDGASSNLVGAEVSTKNE